MFKRSILSTLTQRLTESKPLIQVLSGPRQVGKTTLAQQAIETLDMAYHYASADKPGLEGQTWLQQQWDLARFKAKQNNNSVLLILDEIQKIAHWSDWIKAFWDEDRRYNTPIKVLLLGSSPLLIQKGLTESLAGRFELLPVTHWSLSEMQQAFDISVEQYCYFGGYPGAAELINQEQRWQDYIVHSLIETTISRDILAMNRVHKPALLRQLFQLGCDYPGQILSYQKMLGQLDDAGNTTTLAHYLQLLEGAGMVKGLNKYYVKSLPQRASSPKLQVLNNALITAQHHYTFDQAQQDRTYWGRLVENMAGAHLANQVLAKNIELLYWRDNNQEVDFIIKHPQKILAVEVKSGPKQKANFNINQLKTNHRSISFLLVGDEGLDLETFLHTYVETLLDL